MSPQNTPARRRAADHRESQLMAEMAALDLMCMGAIRKAVERMKDRV